MEIYGFAMLDLALNFKTIDFSCKREAKGGRPPRVPRRSKWSGEGRPASELVLMEYTQMGEPK